MLKTCLDYTKSMKNRRIISAFGAGKAPFRNPSTLVATPAPPQYSTSNLYFEVLIRIIT